MLAPGRIAPLAVVCLASFAAATPLAQGSGPCDITGEGTTQCRGASLQGADLRGAALRGADLRKADLRDAHLDGADLRGARLAGARLHRAHLRAARLDNADLTGAVLDGADFARAKMPRARLVNAHIGVATRPRGGHHEDQTTACPPTFNGWCDSPNFQGANLSGANLAGARIFGGQWRGANLTGANLAGTLFQFSNLAYVNFSSSTATGPVPNGVTTAMRVGSVFNSATLTGASFAGANLSGTSFFRSNTTGANMTGAYVQVTWWLNGQANFNGVTWPATSCGGPTVPWGQTIEPTAAGDSCTTALPGGGSVTFGMVTGGPGVTLQFPTPAPSWWPTRTNPPSPTTVTVSPGNSMRAFDVWIPLPPP